MYLSEISSISGRFPFDLTKVAIQSDAFEECNILLFYLTDMFVVIDETGADRRNVLRKHEGKSPQNRSLLVCGEWFSTIACMATNLM